MVALDPAFLTRPIAHRGLHDRTGRRPENSRAAVRAAVEAGYGAEVDVRLSADGVAMVFHDATLERLTDDAGPVDARTAAELGRTPLRGGDGEGVPTLSDILHVVAGRAPLLIEIKDRDGRMCREAGTLEAAVAAALEGCAGPVAVMSFNPHSIAEMARRAPEVPRGLTTCAFSAADWPKLDARCRADLAAITMYDAVGASFISHGVRDLAAPRVAELRARGAAILCWTVGSKRAEAAARRLADNITFEGYLADIPAGEPT
ncbi:phosphodiesterase [Rhodobacteraceae bacterium WD3A24]|nr:phosphodiesterase [Rhodobacteraceae bacterium WD3A24]